MTKKVTRALLASLLIADLACARSNGDVLTADIIIYGGTSAGVIAAVQAKRMGKSVIVVGPDVHLGGLSSGGLGNTDSGDKAAIGGLAREFYQRIWQHYETPEAWKWQSRDDFGDRGIHGQGTAETNAEKPTMWLFEPHVAEQVFEDLIKENGITVYRDQWLDRKDGVQLEDFHIVAITMLSGLQFKGKVFVDATYEGDLMAAAGVSYHVGREANSIYHEQWNGIQIGTLHHNHHFRNRIDPYVVAGDPSSGLLPEISHEASGKYGEGDHRLQAYCFRMCYSNVPENRIPFPKPENYDPARYELLLRVYERGWRGHLGKFDLIPNGKTDTNNNGPFSTDYIGGNYAYPEADYATRQAIIKDHENYQKGLMYFITNDPRVPKEVCEEVSKWGLAADEFVDNDNWPHQLYIREARRMLADYVVTEHDILYGKTVPDSVGMGSYHLDSHNVQRYLSPEGHVQNEGDIGIRPPTAYPIAYRALIPKSSECTNLLVPVCVSSSHIAFGSIRMEPVFMILGESAATVASLAIDESISVQEVAYETLREKLLEQGQVLELPEN